MSTSLAIFVKTSQSLGGLAQDIESALNVSLQKVDLEDWSYAYSGEHVAITLGTHHLINDRDLLFEDYPYQIEILAYGYLDRAETEKARAEFGEMLFRELKDLRKYHLLMVFDVQEKLDEFHPD